MEPQLQVGQGGGDPMYSPSFRIWGYETNWGSFAQFTKVQGQQCMPKPKHMTWEEAAAYTLVAATAWRMLHGWGANSVKKGDVALIWGGAGGLGSMAIQIAKAVGATPVAVVSGQDKFDYCMKLGSQGLHQPQRLRPLGHAAALEGQRRLRQVAEGRARVRLEDLGRAGRARAPNIVFEHPGETTIPTSIFVCETGGMVVVCAGTTGYNATVDLRYLWMRQKRLQGSHFANDVQSNQMNALALRGQLDPCMSRAFVYDELPLAHQLMHDNKHPHGNMSVLIGATEFGLGASGQPPVTIVHPTLPKDDVHTSPAPYPMSVPLPGVAEGEPIAIADDGTKVRDLMHRGVFSCKPDDTLGTVASIMVDKEIHAVVVMEGGKAIGVVSQTDMVLARQGRTAGAGAGDAGQGRDDAGLRDL
jgi:crotonyl-CoA carboxylase/reductase